LELRYLFEMGGSPPLNEQQRALADQMIGYWARFVATGAPDVDGQPSWPRLNPARPQRLSLQTPEPMLTADFAERHRCGFWASRG
ncbi:MAG: carboxylesterase family protein, partial [Mycobacterium sp.]|nr:carboxylesterase family protein [Mycobacterium sp.]